jgi:hypothetical protein
VLEGVTPVALALPGYTRSVHASRELVTKDRAFRPVLIYVTSWAVMPLGILWLVAAIVVMRSQWGRVAEVYERVRARLATGPAEPAEVLVAKKEETKGE